MIRLYYANRIDRLADALAENIAADERSPLEPVPIVVPSQAITHYLKIAIAERNGIAANLTFSFLRRFLFDVTAIEVPDEEQLTVAIVARLYDDAFLDTPDLLPVKRYLDAARRDDVDRDRRRMGLASQLARLFDAYALERPDRLASWRSGGGAEAPTERWQRAIYLALGLEPSFAGGQEQFVKAPTVAHLFDVAVASPVLLSIIDRLSAHTTIHIYALNPCLEFWEDVQTFGSESFQRRPTPSPDPDDPFGLLVDTDTPALRLWGRPGREGVRMLDQLARSNFEGRFDNPDNTATLLDAFKKDVLMRTPERVVTDDALPVDQSLVMHACPGMRRELEVVAETIWTLVDRSRATDRPLRFNEIAVVLAGRDREAYRAHIGAAFAEHGDIPHHVMDVPLLGSSRVFEAIDLLCALPYSRFTRQDLLRLITHPTVLAKHDDANADEWMAWCEALTVVHGADHHDHEGTYIERDLYNWDQGLKRLALGAFMAGTLSGDDRAYEVAGQSYLPHEVRPGHVHSAAKFIVLVRSLIADARFARDERRTIAEWSAFLYALVTTYIEATSEEEERDLLRALAAIDGLKLLDTEGLAVTFAACTQLLATRLEGMTTNRGRPLSTGVVVAPLSLIYGLPFRVVFMPGLSEGRFPAPERASALDLFRQERRAGQVTPRERDQYAFLLRLLGTEESVHLSWVATRQETGHEQQPAPTVVELLHLLGRSYVGAEGKKALVVHHPLRRWDAADEDHPFASPSALREAGSKRLRRDLIKHLDPAPFPELDVLREGLSPTTRTLVHDRLRLVDPPPQGAVDMSHASVSIFALYSFLEAPLQGWAQVVLRLARDDDEDPFAREDERFGTSELIRDRILRDVFYESVRTPDADVVALYHARANRLELSGELPTGVFGASERTRHIATLASWKKELRRAARGHKGAIDPIRFGRAREYELVVHSQPAILLEVDDQPLEVFGKTQALVADPSTSMVFVGRKPKKQADRRYELRGFIDAAVLAATEQYSGPHITHVAYAEGEPRVVRFEPFSPDDARQYLGRLAKTLLVETHAYALTFDTAVRLHNARRKGRRREMQRILDDAKPHPFGPLRTPRVGPPELERALEMIDDRLGPYFDRRQGDD